MKNYKLIRREDENTFSFYYEGTANELWIDVIFTIKVERPELDEAPYREIEVTHIEIEKAVLLTDHYEADVRFDKSYEDFFTQEIAEMIERDLLRYKKK